jgi:diguanylate cyclase (GGDEF)-like protein
MKAKTFFPRVAEVAHMGVVQTSGDATVSEAVALMEAHNLSDVVFGLEQGHAIFTVEDLMVFRQHGRPFDMRLRDLTVPKLAYVDGAESVLHLLPRFDDADCRYLGVLGEDGILAGVISYTDVMASVDPALMMEHKKLSDVIGKRRVTLVDSTARTDDVLAQLVSAEDAVLVSHEGRLAGIVTTKDAIRMIRNGIEASESIGLHMTSPVWTIGQHETIKAAIEFLKERQYKRAIVVDDSGGIVGVVTQRELVDITYGRWAELMKLHAHELGELVSMLENANRELKKESLTDPLTGVGNRRHINQSIEAEIGRYYRHGMAPFSVLLLDIDHFKRVNDTHGHLAGDRILKQLCAYIFEKLRVSDEIARWGGEEFAIMLPTANVTHAAALADRIRADIAQYDFDGIPVSISIGVAEYQRGESLEDLLRRADEALYASKQGGRNRVTAAG